ncbi:hypothetical protein HK098_005544 [Nowakowskiella sp. JEL0407]|nr:hypothetical protein HK098_005544 [Nowakowskiella sp. JEL0407]
MKLLLVLDLNGTLLSRVKQSSSQIAAMNNTLPQYPYFHLNHKRVYLRPYLDTFLSYIFNSENFKIAVWTSAERSNAKVLTSKTFTDQYSNDLLFDWTRKQCTFLQTTEKVKKRPIAKNLFKVWQKFEEWNETNTVLIDDSPEKLVYQPNNHILIPKFDVCKSDCQSDTTLLSLIHYLKFLSNSDCCDVRDVVQSQPLYQLPSQSEDDISNDRGNLPLIPELRSQFYLPELMDSVYDGQQVNRKPLQFAYTTNDAGEIMIEGNLNEVDSYSPSQNAVSLEEKQDDIDDGVYDVEASSSFEKRPAEEPPEHANPEEKKMRDWVDEDQGAAIAIEEAKNAAKRAKKMKKKTNKLKKMEAKKLHKQLSK